jgi:hypothetical protein
MQSDLSRRAFLGSLGVAANHRPPLPLSSLSCVSPSAPSPSPIATSSGLFPSPPRTTPSPLRPRCGLEKRGRGSPVRGRRLPPRPPPPVRGRAQVCFHSSPTPAAVPTTTTTPPPPRRRPPPSQNPRPRVHPPAPVTEVQPGAGDEAH